MVDNFNRGAKVVRDKERGLSYDGQSAVSNPTPYPHEYSPQPYDGEQGFLLPLLMEIARYKAPPQRDELEAMAKPDYDGAPENELGSNETEYGGKPLQFHVRAPLSTPKSPRMPTGGRTSMSTAGGLNRMLSGLSGASRRGQMASYRVGRPGVVYDAWKTGSPPPGSKRAPLTVPTAGRGSYDGETCYQGDPTSATLPYATGTTRQPAQTTAPSQGYPSGAQNLGAPMSPWLMPWQGQFTAPMSPYEQQGLGGMSNFVGGGMGLNNAAGYNNALLSGQYIGAANPYMNQIQSGMQALKDFQDAQAEKQIGSSMAAGGNALSGARLSANQQYQNLSNANFNQNIGNMQLQNLSRERALQNAGVGQAGNLAGAMMGGYGNLMQAGALPRQLQQQDLNSQYNDWLRQIGSMNQTNQNQQQLANNILHTTYPGSAPPNYGQSAASGWGALLAGLLGGSEGNSVFGQLLKGLLGGGSSSNKPGLGGGPTGGAQGTPGGPTGGAGGGGGSPYGGGPSNMYGSPIGPNEYPGWGLVPGDPGYDPNYDPFSGYGNTYGLLPGDPGYDPQFDPFAYGGGDLGGTPYDPGNTFDYGSYYGDGGDYGGW